MHAEMERNDSTEATHVDRFRAAREYVELDRKHRKRSPWSRVFAAAVVILAASLIALGVVGISYLQGQQTYTRIARNADLSAVDSQGDGAKIDWDALLAANPDTVGWLSIPGTSVNYPVVRGYDNDYYLTHDFEGTQGWLAQYGAIFMDWRNSLGWDDQAYFIYGHHMNDGSMFASIASLADQARFDASRDVYLYTPTGDFKLRTFSLVHCAADDPLVQMSFATPADMTAYIQDKVDRSIVAAPGAPEPSDMTKIFAFATCDNFSAGRYVLYAYVQDATGRALDAMERADKKREAQEREAQETAQESAPGEESRNALP